MTKVESVTSETERQSGGRCVKIKVRLKNAQRIPEQDIVPFEEMKLIRWSSENRANDRLAKYAIDGKPSKVWHSQFSQEKKKHPHELVIDLGQTRMINGFILFSQGKIRGGTVLLKKQNSMCRITLITFQKSRTCAVSLKRKSRLSVWRVMQ